MQTNCKLSTAKAREALWLLEQAHAYCTPGPRVETSDVATYPTDGALAA